MKKSFSHTYIINLSKNTGVSMKLKDSFYEINFRLSRHGLSYVRSINLTNSLTGNFEFDYSSLR